MDKQFETPLSSRSNSPYSESGFTTLILSTLEELNSSPPLCVSRPGSLRLGSGALPMAGSWTGPTSGPLDVPTTGLETFGPLWGADSSNPPENFKTKDSPQTFQEYNGNRSSQE